MMHATPKKKPPPTNTGTAQCVRTFSAAVPRTPGQLRPTFRLPSISPQKASTLQTSPSKLRAPLPFKVPPSPGTSPHPPRLPSPKRSHKPTLELNTIIACTHAQLLVSQSHRCPNPLRLLSCLPARSRPSLPRPLPVQSSRSQPPMDTSSSSIHCKCHRAHSMHS
jgi:hypothetical protein